MSGVNLFASGFSKLVVVLCLLVIMSLPVYSDNQTTQDSHASILTQSHRGIILEFDLRDVKNEQVTRDERTQFCFKLEAEGITIEHDRPQLPAVSRTIIVPPNAGLVFNFLTDQPRIVNAEYSPLIYVDETRSNEINRDSSPLTSVYPPVVAEMSEPFIMRGVRMVRVTTYPVRYDPNDNTYLFYDNIEAEILFTNVEPLNPVLHPERRNRSGEFLKFIRDYAINGELVGRDDPDRDSEPEYIGHYLIVTHENCLEFAAPFIEWRRQSGWKVDILQVSRRNAGNTGVIKNQIQERYNEYIEEGMDPFDQILLIGDHQNYDDLDPAQQWVLQSDRGDSEFNICNHNDWAYACLEGNDSFADVGISRWISGSEETMRLFVHRTLSYERTPHIENTDWFTRGAVYAQRWGMGYHVSVATNVRYGVSVLESLGFDDVRIYENMDDPDANGNLVGPFVTDQFNDGVNVMLGRAQNNYYRDDFVDVNENVVFPIDLNLAGFHEWSCWNMLRSGSVNQPSGPCAATTAWGNQPSLPHNIIWLEIVNSFLQRDLTYGWSRLRGLLGPEGYIPDFNRLYGTMKNDVMFYGDPGLQYWKGVPRVVEVEFPETISTIDRVISVHVSDPETGRDVPGAQVTIYVPGDMPDFDERDYAQYDGMSMKTRQTDSDGIATIVFDEEIEFEEGLMFITVTGREILPHLENFRIEEPVNGTELAGWELEETDGNGDNDINRGETFSLNLVVRNLGNAGLRNLIATVTTASPYIDVRDANIVEFGDVDAGDVVESERDVEIVIGIDCPDAESRPITQPILQVVLESDQTRREVAIHLDLIAPDLVVREVVGGMMIGEGENNLNVSVVNNGRFDSRMLRARLINLSAFVQVIEDEAILPATAPGRSNNLVGQGFAVAVLNLAVPGTISDMIIVFESEEGSVDSAHFQLQLLEPAENTPHAPDDYGYICFDDTDDEWEMAPDYNWIEICDRVEDRDFEGIEIGFERVSPNDIGEAIALVLPFETQFYSQIFNQITVGTNGFISMGDQEYVTNYQNWPMDRAIGGGVGMLAPFWDDLNMVNNSGVFYFFDEDNARFIIEWYRFRQRNGGNRDLTFQVILLDREVWITESGDQDILFQYKTISDVRGREGWENASPYGSIGISSPDGTTGINYSYNSTRPISSARIEDRRALLFATTLEQRQGRLFGRVTDIATGEPVENARVLTNHGFLGISNEDGNWEIEGARADASFTITCSKLGYNDSTLVDLIVEEDGELEINFELLHPEFVPSMDNLVEVLAEGDFVNREMIIENTGNGPLTWVAEKRWEGGAEVEPWEIRAQYELGNLLNDSRVQGVVFANDRFYIAGSNNRNPVIYVLNRDLEILDVFPQIGQEGSYGHKDLAFDGELIWGSGTGSVFGFTPEGEGMIEFDGPFNPNNNFAYDTDREVLWISSTTSDFVSIDLEGNRINTLQRLGMRIYGLSYYPDDPDGYPLYIFHKIGGVADQVVTKMNPETNDTMCVAILSPEGGGTPSGSFCSNQFDITSWVFMAMTNSGQNDRIDVWHLDRRFEWLDVEPEMGVIPAGEFEEVGLSIDAAEIPLINIPFEATVRYHHNAVGEVFDLPIRLTVEGDHEPFRWDLRPGWNLISLNRTPADLDVPDLVFRLVRNDRLMFLKNGAGQFYLPDQNFCNINGWEVSEGYLMKLFAGTPWQVFGDPIAVDQPVQLNQGWNMSAYFPTQPISSESALAGIAGELILAKDGRGRFFHPESGFNNLGNLQPGRGYSYNLREASELVYQIGENLALAGIKTLQPTHFANLAATGSDMSVLITGSDYLQGQEIGCFNSSGLLLGSGSFNSAGHCGLAVWGNDNTTEVIDGAKEGETLIFVLFDGVEEKTVVPTSITGKPVWTNGGFMLGKIPSEASTPVTFGIHETYPNPTNGPVRLSFGLEMDAKVSLRVYDLSGRLVTTLVSSDYKTGNHQIVWNTDMVSSGLYIVKLAVPGRRHIEKIAVLK
ncbi:MAG: T9SS type A sorting domain-containing protein [Calditrichaeota bacterium]|nr:T9SS type A sorting domain-containing protein [Calditrichota bacterium]